MKKEMWDNIEKLSELRSNYSCFDEREQPYYHALSLGIEGIKALKQEPKIGHGRLTNSEWIDFLSEQFDISRTSAKEMLHTMMSVKKEDNFKKLFSQEKVCLVKDLVKAESEDKKCR